LNKENCEEMLKVKSKVIDVSKERERTRLKRQAEKYCSYQNDYTLYPNEEKKWYYETLKRVKAMEAKTTEEILYILLPTVEYHHLVKKKLKDQLKKLKKESCNATIEKCLYEIMQDYVLEKDDVIQNSERLHKLEVDKTTTHEILTNDNKLDETCERKEVTNKLFKNMYKTNSNQQINLSTITCKQNKKLLNEYILKEGNEREWIEKVKLLKRKHSQKPFEKQLAELMPLVRYHKDIKNVFKAKKMAMKQRETNETMETLLNRLLQMYGPSKSEYRNKKIRCYHCNKKGHIRKNCLKRKPKTEN